MNNLFSNVSPGIIIGFSVSFVFILILFIANILKSKKIKKLENKYSRLMKGCEDKNIEELLESCIDKIDQITARNKELERNIKSVETKLLSCIQKIGIIRYNAFENVGSDLSFSIALLDNTNDGVIITGIYSRESSSTYAKPIIDGNSKYNLSAEEIQVLDMAKSSSGA